MRDVEGSLLTCATNLEWTDPQGIVNYTVFYRFITEDKASITFKSEGFTVFFSNAPTSQLINFLNLIYIKVTGKDDCLKKNPTKQKLLWATST